MDIFRRLGSGISKLSLHKKGKSKSKVRSYAAKSDGLTYNSPFGRSFRRVPDRDFSRILFVSPEKKSVKHGREVSPKDFDGSDSSFDKPFLDQSSTDDLGYGTRVTRKKFRTYRKPVRTRSSRGLEDNIQSAESSMTVVNDSELVDDIESLPDNRQSQTEDVIKSRDHNQMIMTSRESGDLTFVNSTEGGNELATKFQPEESSKLSNSDTKERSDAGASFMDANLDSLKSSIEGLIDSGLRFQSPYVVSFEAAANEKTSSDRSNSLQPYLQSDAFTQNPRGAGCGRDLPESGAWNTGDVGGAYCGRKPVSAECESLDSILSLSSDCSSSDADETERVSLVGLRGSAVRRGTSLSEIAVYRRRISALYSKDLPANETLEVLPKKQRSSTDQQRLKSLPVNSGMLEKRAGGKLLTPNGKRPLGKRPSELRNRRIAAMMCPRPFGYKNTTVHGNQSPYRYIRLSDRSREESETMKTRQSELHTVSSSTDAAKDCNVGDECCKLSDTKRPTNNSSTVNKPVSRELDVDAKETSKLSSVISGLESSELVDQSFQATSFSHFRNSIQDSSAQMKSSDVPQMICKTDKPRIATQTVLSEASPTLSSSGGELTRPSLCKSGHQNFTARVQQTARPGDIWWKYPDLEEMKSAESDTVVAAVQAIHGDEISPEVYHPPMSGVTMIDPYPPSHDPLQQRLIQASATQESTLNLEHPFSYSRSVFCTKDAILRQSRKGWSTRCASQDSD